MPRVRVESNIACWRRVRNNCSGGKFSDCKCTWELVGIYRATNEDLGCVHTNRVEWVQSSPVRLWSQGVSTPTESSPIKSVQDPVGFYYSLNIAQVKNSTAMDNSNMLVLYAIVWRRGCRRKGRNMWVQPINIKRPEFEYLATCVWICSRMKRNFMTF